ncbi:hypothetical protein MRX96_009175 [Rhipicephalus microplus]
MGNGRDSWSGGHNWSRAVNASNSWSGISHGWSSVGNGGNCGSGVVRGNGWSSVSYRGHSRRMVDSGDGWSSVVCGIRASDSRGIAESIAGQSRVANAMSQAIVSKT